MLGRLVRFVFKLVLAAFGLVFAVCLLAAALFVLVLSLLKALVTGKKPTAPLVFTRFQKFSSTGMWRNPADRDAGKASKEGDVVDVEVREIREVKGEVKGDVKGDVTGEVKGDKRLP